jgi:hypothetical protein
MDKAELEKALAIAERWKNRVPDHMKDTISGAMFEELGMVSRALLSLKPQELLTLARTVAEWHVQDGDECGKIARRLIALLDNSEAQH